MSPFEQQVLCELRAIRAALERERGSNDELARLLPAIGGRFGSDLFTVRELVGAGLDAGRTPEAIGQLLRRGIGHPTFGLTVEKCGAQNGATLWRVLKVTGD